MHSLSDLIKLDVFAFLGLLLAAVGGRILTGRINTRGLLRRKHGSKGFSPERVQLLVITLAAALNYLNNVLNDPRHGVLPDVSSTWLYLLGGSHATYLGSKAFQVFRGLSQKEEIPLNEDSD